MAVTPLSYSTLAFPMPGKIVRGLSDDSLHFQQIDIAKEVMIPLPPHPGAFGVTRKHHVHEGVDLYCNNGDPIHAIEGGIVNAIIPFTGAQAGMPWWADTFAVFVEGPSGALNYGEIKPNPVLRVGSLIRSGAFIGNVIQVLLKDKGRPRSMLHLELYQSGCTEPQSWLPGQPQPPLLRDPTGILIAAAGLQPLVRKEITALSAQFFAERGLHQGEHGN